MKLSTGWFGVPGDKSGRHSTKVHVVKDGKPICGVKLMPTQVYQWCSQRIEWTYIECERCKNMVSPIVDRRIDAKTEEARLLERLNR